METVKTSKNRSRLDGLGLVILFSSIVIFSPFVYFLINYMLGNEQPVYGGIMK